MSIEIDTSTEFGARVKRRLEQETIIWLTTVASSGYPQPRPVWFWWDGERILILSRTEGYKVIHIRTNPKVSLNLDGDSRGGDIIVILGEAEIADELPNDEQISAYLQKYEGGLKRISMTAQQFRNSYSVAIWITPQKLRGH